MSSTESDMSEINQRKKRSQGKKTSKKPEEETLEEEEEGSGGGTGKTSDTTTTKESDASTSKDSANKYDNSINATTESLKTANINPPSKEGNPSSKENATTFTETTTKKTIPKIIVKKTINLGSDDSDGDGDKSVSSFECTDLIASNSLKPDWYDSVKSALLNGDSKAATDMVKTDEQMVKYKPNLKPSGSVAFRRGNGSDDTLLPLTPFWREHLKALDYHIPLTIFNKEWIEKDNSVSMKTSMKKKFGPTGLPAKSEWYLDGYEWTKAGDLMIEYLSSGFYDHKEFAEALRDHFQFVKKLDDLHCWLTAFRYDMAVRQIVVGHHVNGGPQDPSLSRPEQVEIAKAQTETMRDSFEMRHGNPYAKGQKWEKKSPITGKWYTGDQSHDNPDAEGDEDESNNHSKGKRRANNYRKKDHSSDYHAKDEGRDGDTFRGGRSNRGRSFRGNRSRSPYQKEDRDSSNADKGKGPAQSTSGQKDKE